MIKITLQELENIILERDENAKSDSFNDEIDEILDDKE